MSLMRDQDKLLLLMAYADGEATAEERAEVEALLASSAEARRVLRSIEAQGTIVGALLGPELDARAASAKADTIADAVMARLDAQAGAVLSMEQARSKKRRARSAAAAVATVAAMAAAFALFLRFGPHEGVRTSAIGSSSGVSSSSAVATGESLASGSASTSSVPSAVVANAERERPTGVEVTGIDSPGDVSVFYVPAVTGGNANASSVIIWIGDDGTKAP